MIRALQQFGAPCGAAIEGRSLRIIIESGDWPSLSPLQEDVSKIEFKPSPDQTAHCGYISFDEMVRPKTATEVVESIELERAITKAHRDKMAAMLACSPAFDPPPCSDCRGSGKYQGLGAPEDCRACAGKGRV